MRAAPSFLVLLSVVGAAHAEAPPAPPPYVSVNVGVELHEMERAARDTAQALQALSATMREMASSPSLSEDQKGRIMAVVERVDGISGRVTTAVDRLPGVVRETGQPLVQMAGDLASDVRRTVILAAALLVVVILLSLGGLLFIVLRPTRRMVEGVAERFTSLARTTERSISLIAETNAAQLELARTLERLRDSLAKDGGGKSAG